MNEQPFSDPEKPTTPDLVSRNRLTKQISDLELETARCIAANDAKGAVVTLQRENILLKMLLINELQSTQQMFERLDKRISDPKNLSKATDETRLHIEMGSDNLPKILLTSEQQAAWIAVRALFVQAESGENELLRAGTGLVREAFDEWGKMFAAAGG